MLDEDRRDRSAGLGRRVRRLGAARRVAADDRGRPRRPTGSGFESIWLFDHFHTVPRPTDEITFESFTSLAALAAHDAARAARPHRHLHRVPQPGPDGEDDLDDGHDQRRPDGPRASAPAGSATSGWPTATASPRRRSGWPGSATTSGSSPRCWPATSTRTRRSRARTRSVRDARSTSPSRSSSRACRSWSAATGPNVTWRLAAQHADELNVDGMSPDEVAEALPVIRSRCEEIGRDPATLADLGPHLDRERSAKGRVRVELLARATRRARRRPGNDAWSGPSPRATRRSSRWPSDARAAGVELA